MLPKMRAKLRCTIISPFFLFALLQSSYRFFRGIFAVTKWGVEEGFALLQQNHVE
jgi:hypothetical protein